MADRPDQHADWTPEELRRAKGDFDPQQLAQGAEGSSEADTSGPPHPSAQDQAAQQRLDEKAREVSKTRDERLVESGRGRQTTGRLGGNE